MKHPYLFLTGAALLFACCTAEKSSRTLENSTVEASLDFAKINEIGASQLKYDNKTKQNVIGYTDYFLADLPIGHNDSKNGSEEFGADPAHAPANGRVSIRYGLEYIGKGAKFPGTGGDFSINLNYLAIPIDAVYHYPAGPGQIEGGLGPYFAYGIGGSSNGISSYGQDNGGFKRFDAGLNLQAGYKLENGLSFRLAYDLGLANVEYPEADVKGHTRAFSINIGYQIGRLFTKK